MILNDVSQVEKIIKEFSDIDLMDYSISPVLKSWGLHYKSYLVISFWYNTDTNTLKFKPEIDDNFNYSPGYIKDYTDTKLYEFCSALSLKYKKLTIRQRVSELEKDFINERTKHPIKKKSNG